MADEATAEELDGIAGGEASVGEDIAAVLKEMDYDPSRDDREARAAEEAEDNEGAEEQPKADDGAPATEQAETGQEQTDTSSEAEAKATVEAPEHWPEELRQQFSSLSAENQTTLLEYSKALDAAHEERTKAASQERDSGSERFQQLDRVIAPHRERLATMGLSEAQMVERLLAAQSYLDQNPVDGLRQLARSYNIDPATLIPKSEGEQPDDDDIYQDPALKGLTEQIDPLKQGYQQLQTTVQQLLAQMGQQQLEGFKSATDEQGRLKHPHFDMVRDDIARRVQAGEDIEAAYEAAVWSSPETRALLLEDQRKQAEEAARAEREAAEKAKAEAEAKPDAEQKAKAATEVKASGMPRQSNGQFAPKDESSRDTLKKVMAELQ